MKKARNLGAMRHKIQFATVTKTPDGGGGFSEVLAPTGDPVPAAVETLSAREVAKYQQLQKNVSHRVRIRRNANAVEGAPLTWKSNGRSPVADVDLYIVSVTDPRLDRPGEWQDLICREGVDV